MDILEKLFGSAAKVKILKLFVFNQDLSFDVTQAAERAKVSRRETRREIDNLEKAGLLKQKTYFKEIKKQKDRDIRLFHKRVTGWTIDQKFPYLESVKTFLSSINPFKHKEIIDKISRAGKIQLLVIAGFFIKDPDSRVDILIVGDGLQYGRLENIIKTIESEIGKEIRYAAFETQEFNYRLSLFDKLIRDILDFPHEKIINKLGL